MLSATTQPSTYSPANGLSSTSKAMSPQSPLKPVTSATGYVYPAMWSFPPFFTPQPNPRTFAHQTSLWIALLLSWAKYHRVFRIDVGAVDGGLEVFVNKAIGRRLTAVGIRGLVTQMVEEGSASPDPPKQKSTYLIYWRKPEEWGQAIYTWVGENGLMGSIMTFFEITEGDMAHTTDFHLMPESLLRRSLESLAKQGKAQIFKGEDGVGEGVKFL